ncbi:hypothetical protein KM043_015737 [Ampulex compressa]|nr:hypothetical protein KM043_015737 [Ampulex compressa]
MMEQKPSGLRPPSKIGRPCCAIAPKSAIPQIPQKSPMNMDRLWEMHGRRLSEAGLRRGSDTSVVLTEDTDSFIIGDRVWVGGTKPGAIAYIGETQFAPGDWAGVVLDEPIGKNDGSVAGCRYFQCEPKRGIFSRLTRLTRQPLPEAHGARTPTTPPDSTRGSLNKSMSPSLNTSTTSLSSTVSQRELRLGERVIVSSSQGSKTGVLRYVGATEFAPGEWCGVELDEPIGKNDGSVADKRYFECRPKHGLFAPAHKVSRSPSNKRPSYGIQRPPSSTVRRVGSRESLASVSSIASATPMRPGSRDILKEKQKEIDALRRERDLERERITKAANQADQAEQSALSIKEEYEKYREEMQIAVLRLEADKTGLAHQLEEERRRCEDLLFRFEEESVNKDDIQNERESEQCVVNTVNENRIKELETQLLEERERVTKLEGESVKLFEAEEELARLRNEASNAIEKTQLQDVQSLNQALQTSKNTLELELREKSLRIQELEARLLQLEETTNSTLHKLQEETNHLLHQKEIKIEELVTSTEDLKEQLRLAEHAAGHVLKEKDSLAAQLQFLTDQKCSTLEELERVKNELKSKDQELLEVRSTGVAQMEELAMCTRTKLEEDSKRMEEMSIEASKRSLIVTKLEKEVLDLRTVLSSKDQEIKSLLERTSELQDALTLSEQTNTNLESELRVFESNALSLTQQVTNAEGKLRQLTDQKEKLETDIVGLVSSTANSSDQLSKYNTELREKEKELDSARETISKMENTLILANKKSEDLEEKLSTLQAQNVTLKDVKIQLDEEKLLNSDLYSQISSLSKKIQDMESYKETSTLQSKEITSLINQLDTSKKEINMLQENLERLNIMENEMTDLKVQLEAYCQEIIALNKAKSKLEADQSANRWSIEELTEKLSSESCKVLELTNILSQKETEFQESQRKLFDLQNIDVQLRSDFNNVEKVLKEELKTALDAINAKDIEIHSLKQEAESKGSELKALISIAEEKRSTLEAENRSLNQRLREAELQHARELQELSDSKEKELQRKKQEAEEGCRLIEELKHNMESQRIQLEELKKAQKEVSAEKELCNALKKVEKQRIALAAANQELEKLVREQEKEIEDLRCAMRSKEKEAEKNAQNLTEKLASMASESTQLREAQNKLEKENKQIAAKWSEVSDQLKNQESTQDYNVTGNNTNEKIADLDVQKLKEENESVKYQIEFLNSVIVEMQGKNEALLSKIEVLEMGVPADEADDYSRVTLEKRATAPRMFCDICDCFDLHETEDCPRQAQDFAEQEKRTDSPRKANNAERPYCENLFGHDTRDCDDAETF